MLFCIEVFCLIVVAEVGLVFVVDVSLSPY